MNCWDCLLRSGWFCGRGSFNSTKVMVCTCGCVALGCGWTTCTNFAKEDNHGILRRVARYCHVPKAIACKSSEINNAISTGKVSRSAIRSIVAVMIADCDAPSTHGALCLDSLVGGGQSLCQRVRSSSGR